MKRLLVLVGATCAALYLAASGFAWHANDVKVTTTCDAPSSTYKVAATIVQSQQYPGATVKSITPSTFPGTASGPRLVLVIIRWSNGEIQPFVKFITLAGTCKPVVIPPCTDNCGGQENRQGYCDPVTGQFYDLVVGQDKVPPYDALNLVPAVNGSCTAPLPLTVTVASVAQPATTKTVTAKRKAAPKPDPAPVKKKAVKHKAKPKPKPVKKHAAAVAPASNVGIGKG